MNERTSSCSHKRRARRTLLATRVQNSLFARKGNSTRNTMIIPGTQFLPNCTVCTRYRPSDPGWSRCLEHRKQKTQYERTNEPSDSDREDIVPNGPLSALQRLQKSTATAGANQSPPRNENSTHTHQRWYRIEIP
jgi:hypothetical protein